MPWRASVGLGFIPNRFFRADITLHLLGASAHTALVRDEAARVGQSVTLQPHLGAAYVFADYKEFKATLFVGTYYEVDAHRGHRQPPARDRRRRSAHLDLHLRRGRRSVRASIRTGSSPFGADVFGILARVKMMPTAYTPPRGGLFPPPIDSPTRGWRGRWSRTGEPIGPDLDPIKVSIGIPKNLARGVRNAGTELEQVATDVSRRARRDRT